MKHFSFALLFVVCTSRLLAADESIPRTITYDGSDVAHSKQLYRSSDADTVKAVAAIVKQADATLEVGSLSVVTKSFTPPSGDKHDYMSLSPYWWPDPSKSDGLPYIRKDGQTNPERDRTDQHTLEALASAVEYLSQAYYFTGDEKHAEKAATLIRTFFLDPATKMNPNVRYAQTRRGYDDAQASGCIETNRLRAIVDGDGLLSGSRSWTRDDHEDLAAWFKDFLNYLMTSEQGKKESNQPNNHGTWWTVQCCTYALYRDDKELAKKLINEQAFKRIASQIEPDGTQPLELQRTKAYDYSRFNLEALGNLARYGAALGIDLWNYKSADGRSIRAALDYLTPFAAGEKQWEGQQIVPAKTVEAARVFRWAANAYQDPKYERVVDVLKKSGGSERLDLLYPKKMQKSE